MPALRLRYVSGVANYDQYMRFHLRIYMFAATVLLSFAIGAGQPAAKETVNERNVRAELNFLAGDAMQGRGSGTQFERIAAEYVGSQFAQFGLEPAGEKSGCSAGRR